MLHGFAWARRRELPLHRGSVDGTGGNRQLCWPPAAPWSSAQLPASKSVPSTLRAFPYQRIRTSGSTTDSWGRWFFTRVDQPGRTGHTRPGRPSPESLGLSRRSRRLSPFLDSRGSLSGHRPSVRHCGLRHVGAAADLLEAARCDPEPATGRPSGHLVEPDVRAALVVVGGDGGRSAGCSSAQVSSRGISLRRFSSAPSVSASSGA